MHILGSVSDTESLPRLWFAARGTSRLLRAAAEAAFPAAHLRRWLHVCSFKIPRAALAFHRLAEGDRERAAKRFKRDREDKWAVYGPEVINDQLHFRTFEAVLLGNENHRAYQNGYRDARRLRIERWIEKIEKDPKRAYTLRKKEIDAEWVPNFRMNAVRERLEKKMVEWGEEQYPQPSVIRKRLLESDVPMKRELCTLDNELAEDEGEWSHDDHFDSERYAELGLLWKGRTSEEVERIMQIRAYEAELDSLPPIKRRAYQNISQAVRI
ncbi:hypothetical protein UCDDS831_g03446 [Diplodia seriata]|uniref:Uncharacterized protein n=1 Tax=Diplodia seriata TaxID=420778 RepID=A0A0G2EKM2_9PEZI|nr:hypothetical protein UCDDS831_g03446 [Diplodia seriata]